MKLNNNNEYDGHKIGHALGYFGEYSLAAIYLDDVDYGDENRDGSYDELWVLTDQDDYEGVFLYAINSKIFIDVFEHKILCDLFLCYLKQFIIAELNNKNGEYVKLLNDWYFSNNPKYRIIND